MGDSKPKVNKAKMFEQKEENPLGEKKKLLFVKKKSNKSLKTLNYYKIGAERIKYKYLFPWTFSDKPPPKKKAGGKLSGALAAMKAEEQKMKEAEEQKKQIEEKMKKMKGDFK